MGRSFFYKEFLAIAVMVSVECTHVAVNTLFKAASLKGLSYYVFVFYSYAIASLILIPVPFFFRRSLSPILGSPSSSSSFPFSFLFINPTQLLPFWHMQHPSSSINEAASSPQDLGSCIYWVRNI